jgi:hypothetical protein
LSYLAITIVSFSANLMIMNHALPARMTPVGRVTS